MGLRSSASPARKKASEALNQIIPVAYQRDPGDALAADEKAR